MNSEISGISRPPARPALRYHGGKWKIAAWIISHFPSHTTYCEPFGGAASLLLRKPPSTIECYNDLNSDVVNFFKVLREQPEQLVRYIELTPFSREEFKLSQQPTADPLERARRLYVWSCQGMGRAGVVEPGGWRFAHKTTRSQTNCTDWGKIDHLYTVAARFKQVQIENDDALKVIQRWDTPETLFYVDPPYVHSQRSMRWRENGYKFEYTNEQHTTLAALLRQVQGMVIVSGYPSDLYSQLYFGWERKIRPTIVNNGTRRTHECLWISPNLTAHQHQKSLL